MKPDIPNHIGYIVDGNRRWARARGLPTVDGHMQGFEVAKEIFKESFNRGVKFVSAYIFSTENWNRTKEEINYLMRIFTDYFSKEVKELHKEGIRVVFMGSRSDDRVSKKIAGLIEEAEELTKDNQKGTLALCFDYGGQIEIVDAVKRIIEAGIPADQVTEELFAQNLYHPDVPPIDIMVRTSGEQRLSNFMLWRVAYSELMFIQKTWPDMSEADVDDIIKEYSRRNRRFGQ